MIKKLTKVGLILLSVGTSSLQGNFVQGVKDFWGGQAPVLQQDQKKQIGYIEINGRVGSATQCIKEIDFFSNSPEYCGLFIKIDSTGGAPGAAEAIMRELIELKKKNKLVIVGVEKCCESSAYLIASAADYIISTELATIGTIGIVWLKHVYKELPGYKSEYYGDYFEGGKIDADYCYAGKFKPASYASNFKELSEDERKHLQKNTDNTYNILCALIAANRGLDVNKKDVWADGKLFTGKQAVEDVGLVDSIGSFSSIREKFKEWITQKEPDFDGEIVFVPYQQSKNKQTSGSCF